MPDRYNASEHLSQVLPLTRSGDCDQKEARRLLEIPSDVLFPGARDSKAALSGLLLLLGCWEESHRISQDISSPEGSYWHAFAHRIEPDSSNAAYWFRRVGQHAIFPDLHHAASEILQSSGESGWRLKSNWDPYLFIEWCDEARQHSGGARDRLAREIQQAEWRLLFDWCASRRA